MHKQAGQTTTRKRLIRKPAELRGLEDSGGGKEVAQRRVEHRAQVADGRRGRMPGVAPSGPNGYKEPRRRENERSTWGGGEKRTSRPKYEGGFKRGGATL